MSVKIRRATRADADFAAWVMLAASRGHVPRGVWDLVVNAGDAACLDYLKRLSLAEPRSLCSCESYLVAEVDGRAAAGLTTYKPADGGFNVRITRQKHAVAAKQRDPFIRAADYGPIELLEILRLDGADHYAQKFAVRPHEFPGQRYRPGAGARILLRSAEF